MIRICNNISYLEGWVQIAFFSFLTPCEFCRQALLEQSTKVIPSFFHKLWKRVSQVFTPFGSIYKQKKKSATQIKNSDIFIYFVIKIIKKMSLLHFQIYAFLFFFCSNCLVAWISLLSEYVGNPDTRIL